MHYYVKCAIIVFEEFFLESNPKTSIQTNMEEKMKNIKIWLKNKSSHTFKVKGSFDPETKTLKAGTGGDFINLKSGEDIEHLVMEVPSNVVFRDDTTFVEFAQFLDKKKRAPTCTINHGGDVKWHQCWIDGRPCVIIQDRD